MSAGLDPGRRLRAALDAVPAPAGELGPVVERANRLRVSRRVIVGVIAVIVLAGVAVPIGLLRGMTGDRNPPGPVGPRPPVEASWVVHRVGLLSIETPSTWTFVPNPVPRLIAPKIRFAAGDWAIPTGGECGPAAALRAVPRDGALFWFLEYGRLARHFPRSDFPPQPNRFTLRGVKLEQYECTGRATYLIRFRTHGRFFQVQIAFGGDASPALRAEVLRSISSFRVA